MIVTKLVQLLILTLRVDFDDRELDRLTLADVFFVELGSIYFLTSAY